MATTLTPQIAKLIVLQLSKASAERYNFDDMKELSNGDKALMKQAISDYITQLNANIVYQERITGAKR